MYHTGSRALEEEETTLDAPRARNLLSLARLSTEALRLLCTWSATHLNAASPILAHDSGFAVEGLGFRARPPANRMHPRIQSFTLHTQNPKPEAENSKR